MRVSTRSWVGLVAVIVYVACAGGLGELLTQWFPPDSDVAELVLSHIPVLIPLIVGGVLFVRWSGWSRIVWRAPAAFETAPRRWWMLAFPVLLLVQSVVVLAGAPWSSWNLAVLSLVLFVNVLVGVGEELYFRGILRASIRAHHGEALTLIGTSLLFGAAHALGSVLAGVPLGFLAFQVAVTAASGAVLYGVVRATGRLWVAMALHGLSDFALRASSGDLSARSADDLNPAPANVVIQAVLWALALVLLISCIREDVKARREARRPASTPTAADRV